MPRGKPSKKMTPRARHSTRSPHSALPAALTRHLSLLFSLSHESRVLFLLSLLSISRTHILLRFRNLGEKYLLFCLQISDTAYPHSSFQSVLLIFRALPDPKISLTHFSLSRLTIHISVLGNNFFPFFPPFYFPPFWGSRRIVCTKIRDPKTSTPGSGFSLALNSWAGVQLFFGFGSSRRVCILGCLKNWVDFWWIHLVSWSRILLIGWKSSRGSSIWGLYFCISGAVLAISADLGIWGVADWISGCACTKTQHQEFKFTRTCCPIVVAVGD